MDTAQTSHEKRSIKVKDFLQDFRGGMPDRDLMEKYDLSATGLEKFYNMLLDRNIIDYTEFEDRSEEIVAPICEPSLIEPTVPEVEALPAQTAVEASEDGRIVPIIEAVLPEPFQAEAQPGADQPATEDSKDLVERLDDAWLDRIQPVAETPDETRFICPSCLYSQEAAFDTCPDCGISMSEFLNGDTLAQSSASGEMEDGADQEIVFADDPARDVTSEGEMVFSDEDLFPLPEKSLKVDPDNLDPPPIEIPLTEESIEKPFISSLRTLDREDFFYGSEPRRMPAAFAEAADDTLPTFPIEDERTGASGEPRCEHCRGALEPEVRRIYDRKGAMSAFGVAVISLVLGCLGAAGLAIFDQYSFIRVALIYATGLTMLLGTVFLGLALFMLFFAREKVYMCSGCHRTYPRL